MARKKQNHKHGKNNEIMLLTFLVVLTVSLNFSLIILIESKKTDSVNERIIRTFTGYNPLEIFNREVLEIEITRVPVADEEVIPIPIDEEEIPIEPTPGEVQATAVTKTWKSQETIYYKGEIPILIDYEKGVMISEGKEVPIIVDGGEWEDVKPSIMGTQTYLSYNYPEFTAYVNDTLNQTAVQDYLNKLHPRFIEMETQTEWSSEKFYSTKLNIYIDKGPNGCVTGWAIGGEAHIIFSNSFTNPSLCNVPYINPSGLFDYNNPGELGDRWTFMRGGLHETYHAITPFPILSGNMFLDEGLAEYYGLNILADYNGNGFTDINQETADYYLENANFSTAYGSFSVYVVNDYRDKFNASLQESASYAISAWMFSMMRDNHNLDWNNFYNILNNNLETLDRSDVLGNYYTDSFVIDLFGRASGLTFPQVQEIWRYDGPSGPGWGVRNWEPLDWYADLTPTALTFTPATATAGTNVTANATISNLGQTNANQVSVKFYKNTTLLNEQFVDISAGNNINVKINFTSAAGTYPIRVVVDEQNIKIETNDSNNSYSRNITFSGSSGSSCGYSKYGINDRRNRRYCT